MVASDVGVALSEKALATALETTTSGADLLRAAQVLESFGVPGGQAIPKATLAQLEAAVVGGRSAIVSVNVPTIGKHAMVVDRIADGIIYLRDPLPLLEGSSFAIPVHEFVFVWTGRLVWF